METPRETEQEEQDIARLLRAAGPREELPPPIKAQWEQQFRAGLQPVLARRKRNRLRVAVGLCASVALFVVALSFNTSPPVTGQATIRVSRVSGENALHTGSGAHTPLVAGQQLAANSVISTADNGHVGLSYRGHDIRLNQESQLAFVDGSVHLQRGDMYASDARSGQQLTVVTPHGTIRDIGTQFSVSLQPGHTITTVRQGVVLVTAGTVEYRAEAAPDSAAQVTVDDEAQVRETRVAPSGAQWQWIYHSAPEFQLEGRSAHEFLQWSVAETGLQLQFASTTAQLVANSTLLHGDLGTLDPERAVPAVLATTDLRAQREGGNILLVSLQDRP